MAQAYDFTLEKVGMDIQSYSIWNDYVTFLKGVEAVGSYAENQRISAVRKVQNLRNKYARNNTKIVARCTREA